MDYNFDCHFFTGYKPCQFKRACQNCPHYEPVKKRICVVSLEAMGAVLRSTCLLKPIKEAYPDSHITWVTLKNAEPLLRHNPLINRLMVLDASTLPALQFLKFDLLLAVDKSLEAGALSELIEAREKRGFGLSSSGVIRPFNREAHYQYQVGLDDELKFRINEKPETQQITESMALKWKRDPYVFCFTDQEKQEIERRKDELSKGTKAVIGYNTGCSLLYPYKKLTVDKSISLIQAWRQSFPDCVVALYGGPEDESRQAAMKKAFEHDEKVVNTPTRGGLRSGVMWLDTADLVFSGCSLGMHIAIALKKPTIAWFGVSCIQEVDLYDRGIKIQSPVACSPCWKKTCHEDPKCFDQVPVEEIVSATEKLLSL